MSGIVAPESVHPLPARPDFAEQVQRVVQLVEKNGDAISVGDAQKTIANEFGFANWEQLAEYFRHWELHTRPKNLHWRPATHADSSAKQILTEFANRKVMSPQPPDIIGTGGALSTYIPRFYGRTDEEIFASTITLEEAQLVVARRDQYVSWSALKEYAASKPAPAPQAAAPVRDDLAHEHKLEHEHEHKHDHAHGHGCQIITLQTYAEGADDRERIMRIFEERPEMSVAVTEDDQGDTYLWRLLLRALSSIPERDEVRAWIEARGIDLQMPLNLALVGAGLPLGNSPEYTRAYLSLGADPNWMPNNGISVLEHALTRHGSAESVDMIAKRVTPRRAFWIAAGLGDVHTMQSFFEADGSLSEAAHRDRADFVAMQSLHLAGVGRPNASEKHVIWEAFILAVMNARLNTVQALLDRGLHPDYTPVWMNALHFCVNYDLRELAQLLLSRGADPDFKAWPDQMSPREMTKRFPDSETARDVANYTR